jgi:protocatechuate 3,4-dioxygenase beta subunit
MDRKEFIKGAGLIGIGLAMPLKKLSAKPEGTIFHGGCVLIPTETAGPFPLDLTANPFYFRQDVRETQTGVQLNLRLKIIGENNCLPMQNLRVNIWHCTRDGLYSGYSQTGNQGQAGLTYLRGYQMTDANGEVEFITVFPGWYAGRICHIHFQVYVNSVYAAISQLTFDMATKNAIYAANPVLYPNGADPMTYATDMVFSDGYNYQLASLTPNASTGGYDSFLEVTIQGSGITGVGGLEPETGGQFTLLQNYPNPYINTTVIPFTLKQQSDVRIDLFDINANKVATINRNEVGAGEREITIDFNTLNIPSANYIYQISVTNSEGTFRQCKMMTAGQ